jgi:hypothetical protein
LLDPETKNPNTTWFSWKETKQKIPPSW